MATIKSEWKVPFRQQTRMPARSGEKNYNNH